MSIFKKRDKLVEGAKQLAPEELEKIKSEDAQEQCEELLNPVQEPVPDSQKKEKACTASRIVPVTYHRNCWNICLYDIIYRCGQQGK